MFYATKLPSGIARISTEKPEDDVFYVELDELPEGNVCLYFDSNNSLIYKSIIQVSEDDSETPDEEDQNGATDSEMASAIMEGVNNV